MIRLYNLILCIGLFIAVSSAAEIQRHKKQLSLFTIVTFDNRYCTSQSVVSGTRRRGVCYTSSECGNKGGAASGNCAAGFGVCCLFVRTTSGTSSENCTYFTNPQGTTSTNSPLKYTIRKCSNDVCRVRLDFENFAIAGPAGNVDVADNCGTEFLAVTGAANARVPNICGTNTGQHIYVEFPNGANSEVVLDLTFAAGNDPLSRTFDIKATQLRCNEVNSPPNGCLQWHTGRSGQISTFNWEANTAHLSSQDYKICIRQEEGFCCVRYEVVGADGWTFDSATIANEAETEAECANDYIIVQGASDRCDGAGAFVNRFCGDVLNTVSGLVGQTFICDCVQPFEIDVVFDNAVDNPADPSRGLFLSYRQLPC